jgi:hypothetical protein
MVKLFQIKNKIMQKILVILPFMCVGFAIFYFIKQPDFGFNIIPYGFYMLLNSGANKGGEHFFIMFFDFSFSMFISFLLYKMLDKKK